MMYERLMLTSNNRLIVDNWYSDSSTNCFCLIYTDFNCVELMLSSELHLDDVASDFPQLHLVMAHGGRGLWYADAFFLSRIHPRLFLEISGLPPQNLLKYFPDLEKNVDKVIYGSDWPRVRTISSNIEAVMALPLAEESKKKILYENAARILGLESPEDQPDE